MVTSVKVTVHSTSPAGDFTSPAKDNSENPHQENASAFSVVNANTVRRQIAPVKIALVKNLRYFMATSFGNYVFPWGLYLLRDGGH
jgi:hypothetical protein